jgi:hypothetical protein
MNKKVLEIKVTQESPFRVKALNCFLESNQLREEFTSDTFGEPEKEAPAEVSNFEQINCEPESAKILTSDYLEVQLHQLPPVEDADVEALKARIRIMEDLVIKKKERNGEEFMTWCRKNEELKKIITRLKKEMNADKQNVKRIYEKRILELRKEENHAKTEGFNLKQRIYNLELENDAQEREIEELKQEMDEILHLRKNSETQFQIKNSSTSAKIDELIHENKKLSTTNQELLSKLSLLFSK